MDRNKDQQKHQPKLDDLDDGAIALVLEDAEVEVVAADAKFPAARYDPKAKQQKDTAKASDSRDLAVRGGGNVARGRGTGGASGPNSGRMGERMVAMGFITEDQLNVALQEKKVTGQMLGAVLVDLGFISEDALSKFLAESSGFDVFDPKHTIVDGEALNLIDKQTAIKYQVLPISIAGEEAVVAMADPYDVMAMDALRRYLPKA